MPCQTKLVKKQKQNSFLHPDVHHQTSIYLNDINYKKYYYNLFFFIYTMIQQGVYAKIKHLFLSNVHCISIRNCKL